MKNVTLFIIGFAWLHPACLLRVHLLRCFAVVLAFLAMFSDLTARAGVQEVGPIGLTVGNLDRQLHFYTNALEFELVEISEASGADQDRLLGRSGVRIRTAELKLGSERILLTEHLANRGRPVPKDSRSHDHWFQHIAIVVRDMDEAYARLRRHKVKHVSTAPQTLPEWNRNAAGIRAFYFRDPEDHVLEILSFPPGKGDPKWRSVFGSADGTQRLFLGIDHTAVVVSDTDRSLAFYRDALGLSLAGESENHGVEQEHLNQVFGARLRITTLRAERGPGIELLEYIAPPGGRPMPQDATATDLIFWNTRLHASDTAALIRQLGDAGARFVSRRPGNDRSAIIRDPDGHAFQIDPLFRTRTFERTTPGPARSSRSLSNGRRTAGTSPTVRNLAAMQ